MSIHNKLFYRRLLGSTVLVSAFLASAPSSAQTAQNPAQEVADEGTGEVLNEEVQDIVVTGSRIRRADLSSSSPVAVATAAEIGVSGETANVEDFLNELPQFYPTTTGASNNPGGGVASINLRAAGTSRTLVLVDGKRFMPSGLDGVVDINNIPTPLIDRVEVVTGGASAVYGSDALAGVVNFILKRNFSGVELNAQYNITEQGDASVFTASALVGGNFGDGRGNAVLMVGYTDREGTLATARPRTRNIVQDSNVNAAGTAGGCTPGTLNGFGVGARAPAGAANPRVNCLVVGGSTLPPGVNFFDTGQTIDENGNPRPFLDPQDRFNFAPFNYIQVPQERWTGTATAHYEINDAFVPFGRFSFAWNQVPTELAPTPIADAFDINLSNPFLTPALRASLAPLDLNPDFGPVGDGIVNTFFGRRQLENGSRINENETYSFQAQLGMRGDLGSGIGYEAYYQYGRTKFDVQLFGDVSRDRFQQALLVGGTTAAPVCLDPSNGCVPANIFGANRISPEAADFITLDAQSQQLVKEEVAGLVVNGELPFELVGGRKPGFAVGGEYRKVNGRYDPDEAIQNQVLGFLQQTPTRGSFDVKEAFVEASVPIISESFVHELTLNGAFRYSDYSTVGTVLTYSGGVEFAPIRDVRFRAQYQRAIRAPNVSELFAGAQNNFPAAVDPCSNNTTSTQTPALRAACVNSGVRADAVFNFTQPGGSQVEEGLGGNPNLIEETSDTYTAGVVLQPRFFRGFSATVDYYNIKIDDAIDTFGGGAANIISTCYTTLGGDPTSPFCQAIQRRPNGPIDQVVSTNANIASLEFEGVDFALDYRSTLPFALLGDETAVALIVRGTRTLKSQSQADPISDLLDCTGFYGARCGTPTPKWIVNSSLSLTGGPLGLTVQHRYLSATRDNRQNRFPNPGAGSARPPVTELFTAIDRPSSRIGGYHIFDASANFDINDNYRMSFGVENVLNRKFPVVGDNADEQNNGYPTRFDILGRSFFVSAQVKF